MNELLTISHIISTTITTTPIFLKYNIIIFEDNLNLKRQQ